MDLARAAARQIVGPDAVVVSRHLAWYTSGGLVWYRLESDLTDRPTWDHFDARRYVAQFEQAQYGLAHVRADRMKLKRLELV
jgi:GH43 family beta-xylosidase